MAPLAARRKFWSRGLPSYVPGARTEHASHERNSYDQFTNNPVARAHAYKSISHAGRLSQKHHVCYSPFWRGDKFTAAASGDLPPPLPQPSVPLPPTFFGTAPKTSCRLSSPSNYRIITMNTKVASGHSAEASKTSAERGSQKTSKKTTSKPAPVPSSQPITK